MVSVECFLLVIFMHIKFYYTQLSKYYQFSYFIFIFSFYEGIKLICMLFDIIEDNLFYIKMLTWFNIKPLPTFLYKNWFRFSRELERESNEFSFRIPFDFTEI